MQRVIFAGILASFMAVATGFTATYQCIRGAGTERVIRFKLARNETDAAITAYFSGSKECNYSVADNTSVAVHVEGPNATACGVNHLGEEIYSLSLQTASYDARILSGTDVAFTSTCDFELVRNQTVTWSQANMTDAGQTLKATEDIDEVDVVMTITKNGADTTSCTLSDKIKLKVVLQKSDVVHSLKIHSCVANDGKNPNDETFALISASGCTDANGLLAENKGFELNKMTASEWIAESPSFGCFKFYSSNDVTISCTVDFLSYNTQKSCMDNGERNNTDAGNRKRRAADNNAITEKKDIVASLKIGNYPKDMTTRQHRNDGVCSNLSFVIGLAVMGCVLMFTFIVLVMFVVIRRRRIHRAEDKLTYANNGLS